MKKSRVILSILLALALLFTVAIAAACVDNDDPNQGNNQGGQGNNQGNQGNQGGDTPQPEGVWELQKITVGGNYKTEYLLNESFSAEGLTVSAVTKNSATETTRTEDVTAKAKVDSSRFNSAMVGTYVITISYTDASVTRYADYTAKVLPYEPQVNGISMTKETVEYNIPDGQLAINVNVDDIVVKAVDSEGKVSETALTADEYTLAYFIGANKLDNLEHATRGAYTIQAERKSDGQTAFVIVNVLGGINGITASTTQEKIELANDEATAVINTQDITVKTDGGKVVVANATTGPCTKIDYKLYSVADDKTETLLDNFTVGIGTYKVKITATYAVEADYTITFTAEVTITVKVNGGGSQYHNYKLLADANLSGTYTSEKIWLAEDDDKNSVSITAAGSANVVVEANDKKATDGTALTHRIKLGGAGSTSQRSVKITVTETTTITVYAISSNGSQDRQVHFLDAQGNEITLTGTLDGNALADGTKQVTIGGANVQTLTITVEAGTYYFCSVASGLNVYGINLEIGKA